MNKDKISFECIFSSSFPKDLYYQKFLFMYLFLILAVLGLSCLAARGILDPRPGTECISPAVEGRFLTRFLTREVPYIVLF